VKPTLLSSADIEAYLEAGYWTRDTHAGRLSAYAKEFPDGVACRDHWETYTWAELDTATDLLAANLIALGLARDSCALVRMPSSCREMVLRIALKKAGIIGAFAPMQWRQRELEYVREHIDPGLLIISKQSFDEDELQWIDRTFAMHRIDLDTPTRDGWLGWTDVANVPPRPDIDQEISARAFAFDEVSLITASSGTSGLAKLCEWPEAAQICVGRYIGERMRITEDDTIGIFSPMSGAAGVLVWLVSVTTPATFVFPASYRAPALLDLVDEVGITVATTVPVILARLAQEPLSDYDLHTLRALRVGTAAANTGAARSFEDGTGCRVITAAGSMECPGFAHADFSEDKETRLSGTIGLRLPGCRSRIVDENGEDLAVGAVGELMVTAPYAASGYWNDLKATQAAWRNGWYATGDMGCLEADGRLKLIGRLKETINRSGLKILPAEVEQEITKHPSVFECAVVAAPDPEYGEVPWAFVQPRPGQAVDAEALIDLLRNRGLAHYKFPTRFITVESFPRVAGNKVDKKVLLETAHFKTFKNGEIFNAH
jgi:2,3-dihydroxybenzoate-AMP ligase